LFFFSDNDIVGTEASVVAVVLPLFAPLLLIVKYL